MSADERLYINIDNDEKQIDDLLLKLQMLGFYVEEYSRIKEKYEKLQNNYYTKRLAEATGSTINLLPNMVNTSARYTVDLETDILKPLEELMILANCKHYIKSLKTNDNIIIEDVVNLLEQYIIIPVGYNKERDELFIEISNALYELIKKDAEKNERYEIIDILYEYQGKGYNFVTRVNRLFLEEVNGIFQRVKSPAVIQLVKHATNNVFNKDDIINLMIATGKKVKIAKEEQQNTRKFSEIKEYKTQSYTDRIHVADDVIDIKEFRKQFHVNPLPKTKEENLKLRKYDLSWVDYTVNKKDALFGPNRIKCQGDFRGVDMSYTNAIIIPGGIEIQSFRGANLEGVDMRGVDLYGVDITDTNLEKTGADITGSIGLCLGVSPFEEPRIEVSKRKITPYEFEKLTNQEAFPFLYSMEDGDYENRYPYENRILRRYDLSCVDYSFEYLKSEVDEDYYIQWPRGISHGFETFYMHGFDFSYTNIDIDPQEFTEEIIMNLEGVDLRDKNFKGKEEFFARCNLKGTGANISPKINSTVSEYIVPSTGKVR